MADVETVHPETDTSGRAGRGKMILNWALALLTLPVALIIFVVALGGVMSTAGCSGSACEGPSPFLFGLLAYGAPIAIPVLTIIASFFTAKRTWGIAVPLVALALQAIALLVLVLSF